MKIFHLLLIAVLVCTFSLSTLAGQSYAVSKKGMTDSQEATKTVATNAKEKKAIPQNVNINTADKDLLVQLPGIGPVTADSIIKYRKTKGKFENISELTEVKGIGDKTLAKLKPYLQKL